MKILLPLLLLVSFGKLDYRATPNYGMPQGVHEDKFLGASRLITRHGNSDKFFEYMKTKRKYFSHTTGSVDDNIAKFREDLAKQDYIPVEVMFNQRKDFHGGWMPISKVMKMNVNVDLSDAHRAAIIMHETTHKYGWQHQGNEWAEHDNINSFPYAIQVDFQEYLEKLKAK